MTVVSADKIEIEVDEEMVVEVEIPEKTFMDLFSKATLGHAVAGAFGSAFAMSVFYPLEIVRTRLQITDSTPQQARGNVIQILQKILNEEGIHKLYQGLGPVVRSLCCSNFVYFYTFHGLKAMTENQSISKDLLFAMLAGATNVLVTTPLWVVNTRIKMHGIHQNVHHEKYKGLVDGLQKIYNSEGVSGLWSGTIPSLVLTCNPTIQFVLYEALKRFFEERTPLSTWQYFLLGALAKAAATVATYPIQLSQARLRAGFGGRGHRFLAMLKVLKDVVKRDGWLGLYRGMEAKILQTVLMAALMFVAYEKIVKLIFLLLRLPAVK